MLPLTGVTLFSFFVTSVLFALFLYYRYCFIYWKRKQVPQHNPSFPLGDLASSAWGKESVYVRLQKLYHKFKNRGHKFGGIYFLNGPVFLPVDPDLVKKILVSDFDHFIDRGTYMDGEKVPLSVHIFSMKGEEWRNVRTKFTPIFTSRKMKKMYSIVVNICQNLVNVLDPLATQQADVDIKDFFLRYSTDVIGSTSFGVNVNTLKYPDTEFACIVSMIFKVPTWKLLKMLFQEGLQNPGNILKLAHDNKVVQKYFTDLVRNTIDYRDKNNIIREDFLQMLMQMRSSGMEFQQIVSQAFFFFAAGFETSSSTMSHCVHELAHNQEIQDKLRKEIRAKLGTDSSKYSYDDIMILPYLDMCIKETLRKYPPGGMLNRITVKPYQIPGTDIVIEEGTPVIIPLLGLHRDPEYFPDPLEFDPERFNGENKIQPFTYLPFGEGPRYCIGLRFGMMQTKIGIASLLNDFQFLPSPKSPRHLPVDPSTTTIVYSVLGGVHTKVVKVSL